MASMNVKKGDRVVVLAGKDKGKKGEVIAAMPSEQRVIVSGVNMVKRHTRPSATSQGGIVEKEASIHVSNVAHEDPKDGKATRIGHKILEDGRKVRVARRSGEVIDR
ncbi:50S ribosomal protein L24 [Magnetospirillum sp. ME-1]|jgi:large subunit ribosomal protein L24|uniref:50S ribosomal protein L24 n=1 Tax=Magnetospirillum sp. ME-1 TaxID=1639348 RepID=UPI000A17D271|nr:50S ribosomal protein L24 [Magnetospirillum sp. ME-1]ARJ67471.1 50S ribosomal protein L24 [Magnetospirillum sp. ME-1]